MKKILNETHSIKYIQFRVLQKYQNLEIQKALNATSYT